LRSRLAIDKPYEAMGLLILYSGRFPGSYQPVPRLGSGQVHYPRLQPKKFINIFISRFYLAEGTAQYQWPGAIVLTKFLGRMPMRKLVLRLVSDQRGATAIEYAIIAAGISIVIVAAVNSIGTSLNSTFSSISSQLK
jgi:pilus assembly protein Flp/PilA